MHGHIGQGWGSNSKQREVEPSPQESGGAGQQRERCFLKEKQDPEDGGPGAEISPRTWSLMSW